MQESIPHVIKFELRFDRLEEAVSRFQSDSLENHKISPRAVCGTPLRRSSSTLTRRKRWREWHWKTLSHLLSATLRSLCVEDRYDCGSFWMVEMNLKMIKVYSNHFDQGSMRSELSDLHGLVVPKHKLTAGIFNIFASLQQVIWSMQCDPSLIAISFVVSISQRPKFYEPSDSSWKFVVLGGSWSYLREAVKNYLADFFR